MKKIVLFSVFLFAAFFIKAQDTDKTAALQLVSKNLTALGLTAEDMINFTVTNAYKNNLSGTNMVYLQQTYKGLPVLNQILVLAFKNGQLVSRAGNMLRSFEKSGELFLESPSVIAETAVKTALAEKKLSPQSLLIAADINSHKKNFGKAGIASENITAELMWVVAEKTKKMHLAWQVFLAPKKSADYFLIAVDAHSNVIVNEYNLTVYCNWDHSSNADHVHNAAEIINPSTGTKKTTDLIQTQPLSENSILSPAIVNNASYRVIPFPAESPLAPGGAHALVNNPWTAAPGNATTLKWHSDGTADYNYTRGNNTWAYHDRANQNIPDISRSATSTTSPDPLTFNFIPNFTVPPTQISPVQNQQFNITNLFYWSNIIHDVLYQYGFDEVSGNFQASNQGRGGLGNDYLRSEAQDGSGNNNANFSPTPDGISPRMQMFLWDGTIKTTVNSPAVIAGDYVSVESDFSTNNKLGNVGPVTGQVIYYNDDAGGTLHEACTPPANAITGKIALINRGNCAFTIKVKNAQDAGAIAVIMVNNVVGAPIPMGGTDNTITIPAVMISQADGAIIAAQLANNVNVTLYSLQLDGDLDNGIVIHEYAHGVSNRLTGGAATASCLQSAEQMGEGWSDYYALMLTQAWATANVNTGFNSPRSIGLYALNGENVFPASPPGTGIRSQKYTTDFSINNKVYASTIPTSVHDRGEIWCATLWDMTWNIIQQVNSITPSIYTASGTGGNIIALKLVTEGMKLQPCGPGFIDGRDAIIRADQILFGGLYSCAIREAFRRRGMGALASQGSAEDVTDQIPDFTSSVILSLTQNVTQIPEGQNIVYTNKLVSCGAVSNYLLTDTLPLNVTYVSGGTYNAGTRVVSFPVNFTAAGTQNYTFTVMVNIGSYYTPTTYLNEQVPSTTFPASLTQTSTTATVWTVSSAQSKSAPNSLFSPNVAVPSDQILTTTNGITLGTNQSSISFWHNYNTEAGFDGGVLEISTDNGTSWIDLGNKMTLGFYNGTIDALTGTSLAGRAAYTGNSNGFVKTSADLSSFAGQSTKYRWNFSSDNGTNQAGWYVDDILIKNEAVVNMRTSLFTSTGVRVAFSDTVTLILQSLLCNNALITAQPANTTVCAGANTTLTVTATGTAINYQWQLSTDGGTVFNNITGATAASLILTSVTAGMNNNRYRVIVSNTCPSSVTSSAATLTVTNPAAITLQPANTTVCAGSNASFSVTATGPSLTYQWQVSINGGAAWNNITGATTALLSLNAVTASMNNNQYRVLLSSCTPGGLTSAPATLFVNGLAGVTTQPSNVSVCTGANTSFTVTTSGSSLNYQWQISINGGGTFTNITGATAATFPITGVTAGMNNNQYRVIVSNSCPSSVTSTAAVLTVINSTVISTQPQSTIICSGNNATFSVIATGGSITYQWQLSTNGGTTWNNITGANTSVLMLNAVASTNNNNQYRVVLSDCLAGTLNSAAATLTVNNAVNIGTSPAGIVACTGNNVTFTVTATGTSLSYQWQLSTNGGISWNNITGANNSSLALNAVTAAMSGNQYRVVVSGTCAPGGINSAPALLTVNNSIIISQQPLNVALCAGSNASFTTSATGSGLTYQWQVSTNAGASFTDISGATSSTLALNAVTTTINGNQYRAVLNGSCVSNLFTAVATLTVNSSVTIVTQPASQVGCAPNAATFTVNATGTSITYQWEVSVNGGTTWTPVAGANSNTLIIASLTAGLSGNQYRVIVSGAPCGVLTSAAATLTVAQLPTVVVGTTGASTIYPSQTTTLTATVTPAGTYSFKWFVNSVLVPGANTASLVVNIDGVGLYKAIATSSNGCSNISNEFAVAESSILQLFIYPNPNEGYFQVRYYSSTTGSTARTINVYDSKGAKVHSRLYLITMPYQKMDVILKNSTSGIYYVELLDAAGKKIATGTVYKK